MPALPGYKEQIHHELFDTLFRGTGNPALNSKTKLFGSNNIGNPALTNMQEGGRLSSEEIFLCISIRFYVQFATAALYRYIEDGLFWTLLVGNKPMMGPLPIFVAPCGGGLYGNDVNAQAHVISNGVPDWRSILKFAKPIKIEKHQHFAVDVEFYDFPTYGGGALAIEPEAQIEEDDGLKVCKCFLGGILARNVQ